MKYRFLAILVLMIFAVSVQSSSTIEIPTEIAPTFTLRLSVKGMASEADVYVIPLTLRGSDHTYETKHLRANKQGLLWVKDLPEGEYFLASNPKPPYAWNEYIRVKGGSPRNRIGVDVPTLRSPPKLLPIFQVRGRIIDASGATVSNASVVVERFDQHGTPVAAAMTGTDGRFDLRVEQGAYKMKIAAPGFKLIIVPIAVVDDEHRPHSLRVLLNVASTDIRSDPYDFDVTSEE
jgi:hypothetical protein